MVRTCGCRISRSTSSDAYRAEVERAARELLVVTPQLASARIADRRRWQKQWLARKTAARVRVRLGSMPDAGYRLGQVAVSPDGSPSEITLRRRGERGLIEV